MLGSIKSKSVLIIALTALLAGACGQTAGNAPLPSTTTGAGNGGGGGGGGTTPAVYTAFSSGATHSCALTTTGSIRCWGDNAEGQLGDGTTTDSLVPVTVTGSTVYTQVEVGRDHSCGLASDGTIKCWGGGPGLGDGVGSDSLVPVTADGGVVYTQIAAGSLHTCGLRPTGAVRCWGFNTYGQLGNGTSGGPPQNTPVNVSFINDGTQITASADHTCVLRTGGSVSCWGDNSNSQFGTIGTANFDAPIGMGISVITAVSSGASHNCVIYSTGATRCWGKNNNSQLGVGNTTSPQDPTLVTGGHTFTALTAGGGHTCGLLADGSAKCWGSNMEGALGDSAGSGTSSTNPVTVTGSDVFTNISAGSSHVCAVTDAGVVKCWGRNADGQLGNGTTTTAFLPTAISE